MFHVRFQSEEMAYHTKIGKGLQTYSLCYESHSTKPGDTKKKQNGRRYSENVQAAKGKEQHRHKNDLNIPLKFTANHKT